jgi:Glycosyl hydrolase family 26
MKKLILLTLVASILAARLGAAEITGRFAPPAGKVLLFIGQDNASVGGNSTYHDGYVDNVGVPGGITHYVYFSDGWTNKFGRAFNSGRVAGLNSETEWAAGPMNMKAYVDSPLLAKCVFHLSIAMEGNCEDRVADGSLDHFIAEFVAFIQAHPKHPFLIRIGYEFDGSWNGYDPENFKNAFRRIVDALRAARLSNFATVLASSGGEAAGKFEEYDPGAEYVDWIGYSWWGGREQGKTALAYARKVGKPVFIAESTPRGRFLNKEDPATLWTNWYEKFFAHIEQNKDVVRAVSYINADWEAQDMWKGGKWGQTRVETVPEIKQRWLEKIAAPMFINAAQNPFEQIGFPARE